MFGIYVLEHVKTQLKERFILWNMVFSIEVKRFQRVIVCNFKKCICYHFDNVHIWGSGGLVCY